ncbi:1,25-dihydroxyvitamin D(3) 24-hydroxylase, mitochondrial-like [Glandiceps talaboti]
MALNSIRGCGLHRQLTANIPQSTKTFTNQRPGHLIRVYRTSSAALNSNLGNERENVDKTSIKSFDEMPGESYGPLGAIYYLYNIRKQGLFSRPWLLAKQGKEKFGPIFKSKIAGMPPIVMVCEPRDFEMVLRNEGKYPQRAELTPWILYRDSKGYEKGVLLSDGPKWHRNRSALSKRLLRPKHLSAYTDGLNDVVVDMVKKIVKTRQPDNIVPDIENICFNWATDSSWSIILDKRLHLLDDNPSKEAEGFIQAVHDVMGTSWMLFMTPATLHKKFNTRYWRKHVAAWDVIFDTAKNLIDEQMDKLMKDSSGDGVEETETEMNFLRTIVAQEKLTVDEIYANTTDLMMAAVDTTSNAIMWTLYHLSKNQRVQQKLYEEVSQVLSRGETPTYQHICRMPYVKAVMKESMRLNPASANIPRVLQHDINIRGYTIPAETMILYPSMLNGRSEDYFDCPDEFLPERWLREEGQHFDGFRILPFGFGPRGCIGKRLAELEIHIALATISQRFILESTRDVGLKLRTVLVPDKPLNLKFINRKTT